MSNALLPTIAAARRIGVPDWRLTEIVRRGEIPAPLLLAGRRLWSDDDIRAAEDLLRARGALGPVVRRVRAVAAAGTKA